jgi:hypothetical protein
MLMLSILQIESSSNNTKNNVPSAPANLYFLLGGKFAQEFGFPLVIRPSLHLEEQGLLCIKRRF